jgi:hypothetical protein
MNEQRAKRTVELHDHEVPYLVEAVRALIDERERQLEDPP